MYLSPKLDFDVIGHVRLSNLVLSIVALKSELPQFGFRCELHFSKPPKSAISSLLSFSPPLSYCYCLPVF